MTTGAAVPHLSVVCAGLVGFILLSVLRSWSLLLLTTAQRMEGTPMTNRQLLKMLWISMLESIWTIGTGIAASALTASAHNLTAEAAQLLPFSARQVRFCFPGF